MKKTTLVLSLLSLLAMAAPPQKESGVTVVTLRGSLVANGKPVTTARFFLSPTQSDTVLELDKAGRFEVKAVTSREYAVSIDADGFAPIRRTVELDARGVGEMGVVKLELLRTVKASVQVAPRGTLATAPVQEIELRHGSCANVRAQDDSGCLLTFCVNQEGPLLQVTRDWAAARLRPLGKITLADAAAHLPKGTFVTGEGELVSLEKGETFSAESTDPYCGGLLHVDEVR
jgi:hypothetical protein